MSNATSGLVAIVDYQMGNLFSVQQACHHAGLRSVITSSAQEINAADAVILPGVGAFGDAMQTLTRLDLVSALRDTAASQKPLVGVCLGMQLLMTESYEFGSQPGLGIIEGPVVRLNEAEMPASQSDSTGSIASKVPHVGWNRIHKVEQLDAQGDQVNPGLDPWAASPLTGLEDGEYMYFVHSFYAQPQDADIALSMTAYGGTEFCSSLRRQNIFACQFHPERSGPQGLQVYRNIASLLSTVI